MIVRNFLFSKAQGPVIFPRAFHSVQWRALDIGVRSILVSSICEEITGDLRPTVRLARKVLIAYPKEEAFREERSSD